MGKVVITWYGHSCFKVGNPEGSVIFDPYENGSVPGLKLPEGLEADACFCSHEHADHNAAHLVHLTGRENPFAVSYITVPHDHHGGAKRGMSKITFLKIGGITVAHLGDLGRIPTEEEYAELRKADVVMIPCAGYFTISSKEAEQVIQNLKKPCLTILMHYREGNLGYKVQEDITQVMASIPGVKRMEKTHIEVDPENIPDEVVTLRPQQE